MRAMCGVLPKVSNPLFFHILEKERERNHGSERRSGDVVADDAFRDARGPAYGVHPR